jgi:hypothetical protein
VVPPCSPVKSGQSLTNLTLPGTDQKAIEGCPVVNVLATAG